MEDGFEFFAKRKLVTIFSVPNYCGEFDNAGAIMSVDNELMCSFQILKPNLDKNKYQYGSRPVTPLPNSTPTKISSLDSAKNLNTELFQKNNNSNSFKAKKIQKKHQL